MKVIKYIIGIIVGMMAFLGNIPHNQAQDQIQKYVLIASENNPGLKALFQGYMATLERMPQARALPDPTIAFGVFVSPVETRVGAQQANLSISQMMPWFGQLKAKEQVVAEMAKAKYQLFEEAKNKLHFNVRSTYNNLYVLNKAIEKTQEHLDILATFKDLTRVKFEAGKGSFADILRLDMEIAELRNQLAYLKDSKQPIIKKFEELLNQPISSEIIFPDTLWTNRINLQKEIVYDSILSHNPTLKKYDFEIESLKHQKEVAKKMGMPSFNLAFNYVNVKERRDVEIEGNGKDAIMLPMVGVKLPISRKKYRAMVKEQEIKQQAVQLKKESKTDQLATELELWHRDYKDALRRVVLYEELLQLANQALDVLVAEYTSAGKNFEELLRMDRKILKYALELDKARADRNTTVAYINYLMAK